MTSVTCVSAGGRTFSADLAAMGGADAVDTAREETIRWIKRLRLVAYDGRSMRERFVYRGDSLWWFTELYLQKMRRLDAAVLTIVALDAACERHAPGRIEVKTDEDAVRAAATAFGAARGITVDVTGPPPVATNSAWSGRLVGVTATLSRWRPTRRVHVPRAPVVAAFVHTAFWRTSAAAPGPEQESYIGPVLGALAAHIASKDLACIGVGPRRNFRARRWWDPVTPADEGRPLVTAIERLAPRRALQDSLALWRRREMLAREVLAGDDVRAAAEYRGCDLWPVLARELADAARVQWPWSARAMDEAGAALDALTPGVAVTYAEAGGWGRALMLEARRRGVPSVGLQHGFIYRHWLNYRHEADEIAVMGSDRGCPLPDRTLVFDREAARFLHEAGHFPASAIVVTGSPRLDELASRVAALRPSREDIRRQLGVTEDHSLLVLAAKFTEIAAELSAIVAAVRAKPGIRLVVKPHPAETPAVYVSAVAGATNVAIAPADADLATLLAAADGIVTMNSTVAIDGMALGLPSLVVGLPNNLSPFVDAGAMLGTPAGGDPARPLEALLYDREARAALTARAAAFVSHAEMRVDGRSAGRAATEILALAATRPTSRH